MIRNPSVQKVDMMGQTSFQVAGEIEEREAKAEISEEDIKTVMEQAAVNEEDARKALEASKGDLAAAIISLKGES
jgi:nascent polypeptide-associated complex subunit alpha